MKLPAIPNTRPMRTLFAAVLSPSSVKLYLDQNHITNCWFAYLQQDVLRRTAAGLRAAQSHLPPNH